MLAKFVGIFELQVTVQTVYYFWYHEEKQEALDAMDEMIQEEELKVQESDLIIRRLYEEKRLFRN